MKNTLVNRSLFGRMLLFMLLLLSGAAAFSQSAQLPQGKSSIIMKDGKQIEDAQLWALRPGILEYETDGSLHDALIADIKNVIVAGNIYVFNSGDSLLLHTNEIILVNDAATQQDSLFKLGISDGNKYYNGTGAAIGGTLSGFVPLLGWAVSLPIIAATRPQLVDEDNPNLSLIANKDYQKGYRKAAREKKLINVFGGFAIGLSLLLAIATAN